MSSATDMLEELSWGIFQNQKGKDTVYPTLQDHERHDLHTSFTICYPSFCLYQIKVGKGERSGIDTIKLCEET